MVSDSYFFGVEYEGRVNLVLLLLFLLGFNTLRILLDGIGINLVVLVEGESFIMGGRLGVARHEVFWVVQILAPYWGLNHCSRYATLGIK
jgi:hypothetical protein